MTQTYWRAGAILVAALALSGCSHPDASPAVVRAAAAQTVGTTGGEVDDASARAAYLSQVQVRHVTVSEETQSILGRIVAVQGDVKNTGDRTLSEVELTVYWLDAAGQPVGEKTYDAVLANAPPLHDPPLKPHYSAPFAPGFTDRDIPADFAGKVLVKVTDVQFAK